MSSISNALVELESTSTEISTNVMKMWKSGVRNKFNLAREVRKFFVAIDTLRENGVASEDVATVNKMEDDFYDSLPFGKEVARKFNRIGGCEWLMEFDVERLPNCYNTLDKLTSEKVCGDETVLEYVKSNLSTKITNGKIDELVSEAKNPSADNDNEEEKEESNETRNTTLLTLKVNTGDYTSPSDVAKLYGSINRIKNLMREVGEENLSDDVFNIAIKDSVFESMMKKAKKKDVENEDWKTNLEVLAA